MDVCAVRTDNHNGRRSYFDNGNETGHGVYFFFQAEDGIRCDLVTGVQTCALPILAAAIMLLPASVGCGRLETAIAAAGLLSAFRSEASNFWSAYCWACANVPRPT